MTIPSGRVRAFINWANHAAQCVTIMMCLCEEYQRDKHVTSGWINKTTRGVRCAMINTPCRMLACTVACVRNRLDYQGCCVHATQRKTVAQLKTESGCIVLSSREWLSFATAHSYSKTRIRTWLHPARSAVLRLHLLFPC